ncbi:MAG: type IV toxin-antitoxin system AbiEi family antitoxin domain-containing protein [Candidatus Njordarchaeia archaeon]
MTQTVLYWIEKLGEMKRRGYNVIHRSVIETIYEGDKKSVRTVIHRLVKRGLLEKVANNWYCIPPCNIFDIVKTVFPGSYISLEWALHYHDVIDQEIKIITLVGLGKPKIVKGAYIFELHKIKKALFFGFDEQFVAEAEKALLDTIYIRHEAPKELNLDLLDMGKLKEYSMKFPKWVRKYIKMYLESI